MGLKSEIDEALTEVVGHTWKQRDGRTVPGTKDIVLRDGAVNLEAVYLYSDMRESTRLAREFHPTVAAKVVRAFLNCAVRVIRNHGGHIRSFDGDRVMAIYIGERARTRAAISALKIKWAVDNCARPVLDKRFPHLAENGFVLSHGTGIASGKAFLARAGVRDNNDLISIGRAPNVAAKLSDVKRPPYRTYVTEDVYTKMAADGKTSSEGKSMWSEEMREVGGEQIKVYRSSWGRVVS
jgi:class 3 adenylate cyclase